MVVYGTDSKRQQRPQIEEGATVRERQLIVRIYDLTSPMQVNAKVAEAMVDQDQPGQKAEVKVDAFPGESSRARSSRLRPSPTRRAFPSRTSRSTPPGSGLLGTYQGYGRACRQESRSS